MGTCDASVKIFIYMFTCFSSTRCILIEQDSLKSSGNKHSHLVVFLHVRFSTLEPEFTNTLNE